MATMPANALIGAAHEAAWVRPLWTRTAMMNTQAAALSAATKTSTIFLLTSHS
jgi:hypothetical protein